MKYMIRRYEKNGSLHDSKYADTLDEAIRIRKDWIDKKQIKRFASYPTIWEHDGEEYIRLAGF